MEEVVEGTPKIDDSPTEVADNPAEALACPPETDDSPVESRDSPGEAGDSPVEAADSLDEAEDSPAQVADSPAEEEDITTQIELAEKSNTRVTRKRTKVTVCFLIWFLLLALTSVILLPCGNSTNNLQAPLQAF